MEIRHQKPSFEIKHSPEPRLETKQMSLHTQESPLFVNGLFPSIAIIDDDWGEEGAAHDSKDVIEIQLGKQADIDGYRLKSGSPFQEVFANGKDYDYIMLPINEMNNKATGIELGWGGILELYSKLQGSTPSGKLNVSDPDLLSDKDKCTIVDTFIATLTNPSFYNNTTEDIDVDTISDIAVMLEQGLGLMKRGTNIFQAGGDVKDDTQNQMGPLSLLEGFNQSAGVSGNFYRVGATRDSIMDSDDIIIRDPDIERSLKQQFKVNAGFNDDGVNIYAAGVSPYTDSLAPSTRNAVGEAIVSHVQYKKSEEGSTQPHFTLIGPNLKDIQTLGHLGLPPYIGEPGAAPQPGEPGAAPQPGEPGSGVPSHMQRQEVKVDTDPALLNEVPMFLNGVKPRIAIIDGEWGQEHGHGPTIKNIFQQQFGTDGFRVDITALSDESQEWLASPFSLVLENVQRTGSSFDYVNLSRAGLDNYLGWGRVQSLYNQLSPDNALNLSSPNELTNDQRKEMALAFINSRGHEHEDINAIGKMLDDGLNLMRTGTHIYQAAGNDVEWGDNWGAEGLLKAFNDEVAGSFTTVGSLNRDIHQSQEVVLNSPQTLENLLDSGLVFGGYQLDDVSLFANGRTSLDPDDRYPGATSWATPEAISSDISNKTGWEPVRFIR